jgi:hypothetical protein
MDPEASDDSGSGSDATSESTKWDSAYVPPPPPDGGLWCGTTGSGDAGTYCQGTCCVKIGNGYSFECHAANDPCTGFNYAFSCDRSSDCPGSELCCYTEVGNIEAGTYFAASHCGTCQQMESMCLYPNDDCPDNTVCHPWFSTYGQCY